MEEKVVRRQPVSADPYKKSKEELMEFVSKQIEMMNSYLLFSGKQEPGIYELNQSLMNYESVMLGLIAIHADIRSQLDISKEKYDAFYASKFVELKEQQVKLGKSATFTAQREIELYVRNTYIKEISQLKADIIMIDNQYNTVNYLISSWEKYSFILGQLSANSRAEAQASGIAFNNRKEFGDEE